MALIGNFFSKVGGASLPTIAFASAVAQAEGSSGTTTFTFLLNLTRNGSTAAIPFAWSVTGSGAAPADASDFVGGVLPSGSGTFAAGETSKAIVVNVAGDSTVEPDEGFTITATASLPLAPASAAGVIVNDDVAPAITELLATSRLNAPGWNGYYGSDGTDTNSTTRLAWTNESGATITRMKVVVSNWLLQATSERDGYNPIRKGVEIEYPAGTFTRVPFDGSTALVTIPPSGSGNTKKSDEAVLTTPIPPGALAWVRDYVEVDAGGKWPQAHLIDTSGGSGEAVEFNVGAKFGGGTITNAAPSATRRGCGPLALIVTGWTGTLRTRATVGAGDSLARGDGGIAPTGGGLGYLAVAAAGNWPHLNWGFTGTKAQDNLPVNLTNRLNALSKGLGVTIAVISYFSNDAAAGRTGPAIYADYIAIANAYKNLGLKIAAPTGLPRTTTTTAGYTLAGQTPISAAFEAARASYNASIRAQPAPIDLVLEVGDAVEPTRGDGRWINGDVSSSPHLQPSIDATVTAGSTTTVVNTNLTTLGGNDLRFGGGILFTSGALAGTFAYVTAHNGGGAALTVSTTLGTSTPLASAPAAGDTIKAMRLTVRATADTTHPNVSAIAASVPPGMGGQYIMGDVVRPAILAL